MMTGYSQLDQPLVEFLFRPTDSHPKRFPQLVGLKIPALVKLFHPSEEPGILQLVEDGLRASTNAFPNSSAASGPEPVINWPSRSTALPV